MSVPLKASFATAGTADEFPFFRAPIACTVSAVRFVPETAITADATNYATLSVENKELAGSSTIEIASFAFDTATTDDVAAMDEKALTLSGTAANLALAVGEIVSLKKAIAGSGMALDGYVILELTPAE